MIVVLCFLQVHVNVGISFKGESMLTCACDHYREAAILNPRHYCALEVLGGALFGLGEYQAAKKCLQEALVLKTDYADAHCDLGSALHAVQGDGTYNHLITASCMVSRWASTSWDMCTISL